MKLRLNGGFGAIRNIVPVAAEKAGPHNGIVGDMHILRRSGWRGGPTYRFHPNEHGETLGLKHVTGTSVRQLLKLLETEHAGRDRFVAHDFCHETWRVYRQRLAM